MTTIEGAMPRTEDLGDRRQYLGWSEIGAALNQDNYRDAYSLWRYKVGLEEDPEVSAEREQARRLGHRMEPVIAAEYEVLTGRKTRRPEEGGIPCPDAPWLIGHPDFLVETAPGEPTRYLECKATGLRGYGEPGTNDVPKGHYAQGLAGCSVMDLDFCDIGAMPRTTAMGIYYVARADDVWRECLRRLAKFWDLVLTKTPPEPHHLESFSMAFPEEQPGVYKAMSEEDLRVFANYLNHQKYAGYHERKKKECGEHLKKAIRDAESLGVYDRELDQVVPFVNYRVRKPRVDWAKMLKENPDVLGPLLPRYTPQKGSRTLLKTRAGELWYQNEGEELVDESEVRRG